MQTTDVDAVVSDVQQMSLESVDMSTTAAAPAVDTASVPGYGFVPDPDLLPGNFVDPAEVRGSPAGLHFLDADFAAADAGDQLDVSGGFPATIDADWWSQLNAHGLDEPVATFDATDFSDLIVFQ